jgi:uncharacterized membrane protein YeaQ/YmgE (transglycosylase-associated protein family)
MASIVADTDRRRSVTVNVVVGTAGALIGGMLISPLIGAASIDNYGLSFPSVLIALSVALLLLVLANRFRRSGAKTGKSRR